MKLRELDEFKLADAVKFHSELNPVLFDDDHLDPEVRQQLLVIAQDFIEHLGISDIEVKDIRISGSNAAYTYTAHSDIDLHIIVDIEALGNDEVYRELFTAKKTVYNDSHDITVRGFDVELYVEDSRQPVKSLGEYSVLKNKWIKYPVKRRSNFDELSTRSKFTKLVQLSQLALESDDLNKIQLLLDTIKKYRQAGLETHGEFGPENLAYKALRTRGIVDKLYKHRDNLHGRELSLNEKSEPSNLKQLKNAIQQLPTWKDYISDRKSWWNYRNKISDILFEMGKIKLLRPILRESIDRINRSRVLGENYEFPKNNTRCLSGLISFINTEQVLPSDLKNGQTLDLVRINTINYSKVLILEIHRGVTVDKIIDDNTVIVQGDNNLHRIVVDEILIDNLDTGYYSFFLDADKLISGLFFYKDQIEKNEWSVELDDTKLSEDYHPNDTPPGPEFKPTMPAGTVKVDVSDVYDWYKLGQHISNLKGLGHHDFGQGPPSTIMAFGSEDEEHKYIDALKKTGLTTTDIDPIDPNQPKGMPRQKTDPTYNVNESSKTNSIDKRAQDLFDEYRNFIDYMEFDYGDVPLYEDFEQLNDTWRNYEQKILKWCWNSGGTGGVVSPAPIIKNLKENIWKVSNSLMENSNPQRLIKLLDTAFGKSKRIKSGAIVDIIEIVSPTDGVVQITTYENIKVANVKRDGNGVVIIDTNGNFYRTGQYLGRKIELRIIAKPGTAERGLTLLRLYVEHDRDGNKTYDGWKIDFPGDGFSTRLSNKFKSIKEASGYIPSEKERNDPRFKTALTVDVHPDTMKRDAKKFGNKISRAGIPPTANPSGKV